MTFPLLEETVRQAHQLDSQRKVSLDAAPSLTIMGDRDAIKQILLIAMDNALKHSSGRSMSVLCKKVPKS